MALLPDANWKRAFRRRLKHWYQRHARDLPWRRARDPYHIWVSEIMLQQTQVVTVIPYFERFLAAFPTVADLAAAEEHEVLRLWEGLGYYRRARQLYRAAEQIVGAHEGEFPRAEAAVGNLPGIGRYTRGAILSIAFDQRLPILEANTLRLYCRLLAYDGDPLRAEGQRLLWAFAEEILPRKGIGTFNQALMELGGTICTPRSPRCLSCPVGSMCRARAAQLQEEIPVPKQRMKYVDVAETAVVVFRRGRVLLRKSQEGERWAGLWDFPRFLTHPNKARRHQHVVKEVKRLTGVNIEPDGELATIKHGVTRFRITLTCRGAKYTSGKLDQRAEFVWAAAAELGELPLSVTGRKIVGLLSQ